MHNLTSASYALTSNFTIILQFWINIFMSCGAIVVVLTYAYGEKNLKNTGSFLRSSTWVYGVEI